jgi:hypothetical protein
MVSVVDATFEAQRLTHGHAVRSAQIPIADGVLAVDGGRDDVVSLAWQVDANRNDGNAGEQCQPRGAGAGGVEAALWRTDPPLREESDRVARFKQLPGFVEGCLPVAGYNRDMSRPPQIGTKQGHRKRVINDEYLDRLRGQQRQVEGVGDAGVVGDD